MLDKQRIFEFAMAVAESRPSANPKLEQFLMTSASMVEQAFQLARYIDGGFGESVVMIGDDDHLSIVIAMALGCQVDVFEYDQRVIDSINSIAQEKSLPVHAVAYDVREPFPNPHAYEFFYINPPYSSKTRGLGLKVWLTRSIEACVPHSRGVIVMPRASELKWTQENLLEVQSFLIDNGFVIAGIGSDMHTYERTNDRALMSTNFYVERLDPSKNAPVADIDSATRIYR